MGEISGREPSVESRAPMRGIPHLGARASSTYSNGVAGARSHSRKDRSHDGHFTELTPPVTAIFSPPHGGVACEVEVARSWVGDCEGGQWFAALAAGDAFGAGDFPSAFLRGHGRVHELHRGATGQLTDALFQR